MSAFRVGAVFLFSALFVFVSAARAGNVNWAELNPAIKDSSYVGSVQPCLKCHEDYIKAFARTKHARSYKAAGKNLGESCETCHGPAGKHLETKDEKDKAAAIVSFKNLSADKKSAVCLQCHEKGEQMYWRGSVHEMGNVSCDKCHYVMARKSQQKMTIHEDSKAVCFMCHKDKRARMYRSAHMPLREGKMSCASCHNPHGSAGPSQLRQATVNETCYLCHQEKRGPMLWEHAPVRENCSNCHDPHGSNQLSMLKQKVPFLCQTCHVASFHPSTAYGAENLPGGAGAAQRSLLGKGCLNCHSRVHGSNHPSGARLTR